MSAYTDLVMEIKRRMMGVTGIGTVHIYQRNLDQREPAAGRAILNLLLDKTVAHKHYLRGWMISRRSATSRPLTNVEVQRNYKMILRGYLSLNDDKASELEFQQIIDDIHDTLAYGSRLEGSAEVSGPVQIESVGYAELSGNLCHFAELSFDVQVIKNFDYSIT